MIRQVFCDESRPRGDRFMVLGGIIVPRVSLESMGEEIQTLRHDLHSTAELKWGKVSKGWLSKYKAFVDYFFEKNENERLHFHSLIIDRSRVDHRKYSDGDAELGFYKFYYQLLLHCFGKNYCPDMGDRIIAYLDQRQTSYPVPQLRRILNHGVAKNFGNKTRPFLAVTPVNSKQHDLIQLTDVLIGAIGYHRNGLQALTEACPAKVELADYIAKRAGVKNLGRSTPYRMKRFTVWNLKFRDEEKVEGRTVESRLEEYFRNLTRKDSQRPR